MFRKIMVPIDGSPTSNLGLEEAMKLAKENRATLYLFHVVDEVSLIQNSAVLGGGGYVDTLFEDFVNAGKKILAEAEAKVRKHRIRSKSLLVETFTAATSDLIVNQAKRWGVNLIVLGTHGRRGIRRLVLGSDAEGVVRATPVPVLLVRGTARPRKKAAKRAKRT